MALLGLLSPQQTAELENRFFQALEDTSDEMGRLEALNPPVRELLYGPRALESLRDVRNDLVDILADDLPLAGSDYHYCGHSQFPHAPRPGCSEWTTPYRKA